MSKTIGYKKNWYKEWFGEEYLTVYKHRNNSDAIKLIELILKYSKLESNSRVLDLACGNGRHAFILSKKGFSNIVGLDLSEHLLTLAQKNKIAGSSPAFVQSDMRYFPFNKKFDAIFSLFTSFGYFEDDTMHELVAAQISDHLFTNGYFVIDYFNAEYVRSNLVEKGVRKINQIKVFETRWIENNRVIKKITLDKFDDQQKVYYESVRMFTREELIAILEKQDIKIENVFGDYDGCSYSDSSKRMILIGKRMS